MTSAPRMRQRRRSHDVPEDAPRPENPPHREVEGPAAGGRAVETTASQGEIDRLVLILRERYPDVAIETITSLIEQAHAELAGSRIQSFRMVLTERAVRRRLLA